MRPAERFGDGTPGVFGYLLAVVVSVTLFSSVLSIGETEPMSYTDVVGAVSVIGALLAWPLILLGLVVVHLGAGSVLDQWLHVLLAGVMGMVTGLLLAIVIGGPWGVLLLGACTAAGRLYVVPLVWWRRDRFRRTRRSR